MLNTIKSIVSKSLSPKPGQGPNSFSQAGEDVVVDFLFKGVGIDLPSYLELGTHDPKYSNNTYKYYLKGARGVLVEADPTLIERIQQVRPEDKLLNIGVGITEEASADFYVFEFRGMNTFNPEEAAIRQKENGQNLKEVIKMPLKSINDIIKENFETYPDYLSIDVEGLDLAVLKTLDLQKYPIPVMCVETCTFSENHIKPKDPSIAKFLNDSGYFVYADTYINTIFVNSKWFLNAKK